MQPRSQQFPSVHSAASRVPSNQRFPSVNAAPEAHFAVMAPIEAPPRDDPIELHRKIQRLDDDERSLLANPALSSFEKTEIHEQFFLQKMALIQQLPADQQNIYHVPHATIRRMGTVRENINKDVEQAHKPYFCYFMLLFCIAIFIGSIGRNGWEFEPYSENPLVCTMSRACHWVPYFTCSCLTPCSRYTHVIYVPMFILSSSSALACEHSIPWVPRTQPLSAMTVKAGVCSPPQCCTQAFYIWA